MATSPVIGHAINSGRMTLAQAKERAIAYARANECTCYVNAYIRLDIAYEQVEDLHYTVSDWYAYGQSVLRVDYTRGRVDIERPD